MYSVDDVMRAIYRYGDTTKVIVVPNAAILYIADELGLEHTPGTRSLDLHVNYGILRLVSA